MRIQLPIHNSPEEDDDVAEVATISPSDSWASSQSVDELKSSQAGDTTLNQMINWLSDTVGRVAEKGHLHQSVLRAWSVYHFKIVFSQCFQPAGNLSFRVPEVVNPLERVVVCSGNEHMTKQVWVKVAHSPNKCKQLFSGCTILFSPFVRAVLHRLLPAHGHQLLVTEQVLGHFHWRLHQG